MPRPRHINSATALATNPLLIRRLSNSATPTWPLLRKRKPIEHDKGHAGELSLIQALRKRTGVVPLERKKQSTDPRVMLVLQGLSPSLNASEFYRLAPSDLSSWQSAIKKVQQQLDHVTFEPLGRYHVTFANTTAAVSYQDRLLRLYRLARFRLEKRDGLWESCVPAKLRSAAGEDPATELERFTITAGLANEVHIRRKRVGLPFKWPNILKDIAAKFEYGENPPLVLVRVYPPTVTASKFGSYIQEDSLSRGCEWKVSPPQVLLEQSPLAQDERADDDELPIKMTGTYKNTKARPNGQFVVVCANHDEARRFHRHWNQRTLTTGPKATLESKNIVHASIISL